MQEVYAEEFNLPIQRDVCFSSAKGKFKKGIQKRQLKILGKLMPFLKNTLDPGEEILLAVTACSPMTVLEQLTTGMLIYYTKRCVLVLTTKRILHFPAKSNYAARSSVAQIAYGDIGKVKLQALISRNMALTYKSGKKETFYYISGRELPKLKSILPGLISGGETTEVKERFHLCPRCKAWLLPGIFVCRNCRLKFKDWKKAKRVALLYPGGGYFYAGHRSLGVLDAITESALLLIVLLALLDLLSGNTEEGAAETLIFFGFFLVVEKLFSIYQARKFINEYIPEERIA